MTKYVDELTTAGLELPAAVRLALEPKTVHPFAVGISTRIPEWAAAHGYDERQQKTLGKLIGLLTRRTFYLQALASGVRNRIGLDGEDAVPPSEADCESAAKRLAEAVAKRRLELREKKRASRLTAAIPASPGPSLARSAEQSDDLARADPAPTSAPAPLPAPSVPARAVLTMPAKAAIPPQRPPARSPASAPRQPRLVPPSKPKVPPRPPLLPAVVIRESVERTAGRRNAVGMIKTYLRTGNTPAIAAERAAWASDAVKALAAEGHPRDVAALQVSSMIEDMLVTVVPKQARR